MEGFMPDITMCSNLLCIKRSVCYRYMATPNNHWQSYASFNCKDPEWENYIEYKGGNNDANYRGAIEEGRV
jgi:hypothetical protein